MIDPHIEEDAPEVTRKTLRQFAGLSIVVLGGLAVWHGLVTHRDTLALTLAGIGFGVGAIGLAWPDRIRPIFTGLMAVTMPIGHLFSLVMTALLFYGVFTPIGLIFGLFGRDALQINRQNRASHWVPKRTPEDLRDYMRQ